MIETATKCTHTPAYVCRKYRMTPCDEHWNAAAKCHYLQSVWELCVLSKAASLAGGRCYITWLVTQQENWCQGQRNISCFHENLSLCMSGSGVMIVPLSRIISPISRIMVNYPHNVFMFNDLRGRRGTLWSLWGLSSILAWRPIRGQMADKPIRRLLCNKCLGNLK